MIIQPAILLIIATLALPTHQTSAYASRNSIIDWSDCENHNCYCDKGGSGPPQLERTSNKLERAPEEDQTPEADYQCNTGYQMKYINSKIGVVQLQVLGAQDLGDEPEFMLALEDIELFGCKFNKNNGVVFKGDSRLKKKYKLSLFEDRSRYKNGLILCAIKIGEANKFFKEKYEDVLPNADQSAHEMFKLTKFKKIQIGNDLKQKAIFGGGPLNDKCDTYAFKDIKSHGTARVKLVLNRDRKLLSCDNYGEIYKMRYMIGENTTETEIKKLECKNKELKIFVEERDDDIGEMVPKEQPYVDLYAHKIYCAADFSKVCDNPTKKCKKSKETICPQFTPGTASDPALLTCPGKKWLINGEYHELDEEPVCKQDTLTDLNSAVFSITYKSGKVIKNIDDARCFKEYDCRNRSSLHLPKCEDTAKCGLVEERNILKCKDENAVLTVLLPGEKTTLNTSKIYTCNTTDGLFYNSSTKVLIHSKVTCIAERKNNVEPEALSPAAKYGIMAALAIGIIAIIMLCTYFVIRRIKNSHIVQVKGKKAWKKLKKSDKIEACRKAFREKVMLANSLTADNLFAGLDMVEILLETETDSPECWAEVIPFLMRFQGSIVRIDHGVWHLFSRYMYLQAAKIIEKHGWLTDKPIRKKKQKGLIRTVAIHLLSFAIYDPLNPCAEELVETGFQKLGWKAVEQYPHCGQMWALIMHARPIAFTNDETQSKFAYKCFREYLKSIMDQKEEAGKNLSIPKEETIPPFGSIAEQAAYAIGACQCTNYHHDNGVAITTASKNSEEGRVPTAYFRGLCESATRNPVQGIIIAYKMWPTVNAKTFAKLKTNIPEDALEENVQNAMKIAIYYGRPMDAKRLHTRFLPKVPETEVDSWQEQQEAFEEAVENKKEALRKWFAKRTDIEELKKKPVYVTSGKVVLDNRIKGDEVTNVEGGTKSGSNSATASDEKDPASPAAPTPEAAAGAAVAAPSPPPPPAAGEAAAAAAAATPPVVAATPPSAPAKK